MDMTIWQKCCFTVDEKLPPTSSRRFSTREHVLLQSADSSTFGVGQKVEGTKPRQAGDRLAASYANFYIANGGVVMPAFGGEAAEADLRCAHCRPLGRKEFSAGVLAGKWEPGVG